MATLARDPLFARTPRRGLPQQPQLPQNRLPLTTVVVAVPFKPYDWPQPKRRAFVPQDTGITGILLDIIPMIRQNQWPNPVRPRYVKQPDPQHNLLTTTLAPAMAPQAPFMPVVWPQRARLSARVSVDAPNLLLTTLAPVAPVNPPFIPVMAVMPVPRVRMQWPPQPMNLLALYTTEVIPPEPEFDDITTPRHRTVITRLRGYRR